MFAHRRACGEADGDDGRVMQAPTTADSVFSMALNSGLRSPLLWLSVIVTPSSEDPSRVASA